MITKLFIMMDGKKFAEKITCNMLNWRSNPLAHISIFSFRYVFKLGLCALFIPPLNFRIFLLVTSKTTRKV
jgi:hypothetical protein